MLEKGEPNFTNLDVKWSPLTTYFIYFIDLAQAKIYLYFIYRQIMKSIFLPNKGQDLNA